MIFGVVFFAYGVLTLSHFLLSLLETLWSSFTYKGFYYPKGSWAIITACTDGLGLGFSEELAKRGLNIIQISRNSEKLEKTARFLSSTYNVQVKSVVQDIENLALDPISFVMNLKSEVSGLKISVLVNNAGGGVGQAFVSSKNIHKSISYNIFGTVFLTKLVLDSVGSQQKYGIINVSSVSGVAPGTRFIMYKSCKAFVSVFSGIASEETGYWDKKSGSLGRVLCLRAGLIDTPATAGLRTKPLIISKYECANSALRALGVSSISSGHWKHMIIFMMTWALSPLDPLIGDYINRQFETT